MTKCEHGFERCGVCHDKSGAPWPDAQRPVEALVIPPEALDLIRFLCATWTEIYRWAYANADGDALCKYPVIQGTRNQLDLQRIGEQAHDTANIRKAVKWMLEQAV